MKFKLVKCNKFYKVVYVKDTHETSHTLTKRRGNKGYFNQPKRR